MTNYLISLVTLVGIYGLMALGLNVMWGMAGLVNLGIVGFFAVGAYVSALLVVDLQVPVAVGLLAATVASGAIGVLTCYGLRHLRDDYLAIVTLGFAEVVRIVAENEIWLTHGTDGISGIPQPMKATLGPGRPFDLFYMALVLVLFALAFWLTERLRTAPFGRVLRAVRDDHQVAAVAGKRVSAFQVRAFGVGSALAGLAGALYAHYTSYISPELFVPLLTIYIFLAVTAGGKGSNLGAVIGSVLVIFFLESTRFVTAALPFLSPVQVAAGQGILIGIGLLLVLRLRPQGLLPERAPRLAPRLPIGQTSNGSPT